MREAVTIAEMLEAEAKAIQQGCTEARLLESAGHSLGSSIHQHFPHPGTAIAYLGKGHNAGDALVALKLLRDVHGWEVGYRAGIPLRECAPLVQEHAKDLEAFDNAPTQARPLILLDGLLGTGSKGAPRAPLDALVEEMGQLRNHSGAKVIAVDLPSGIDADTGEVTEGAVVADLTLMIANAKVGLLKESCAHHTGALGIAPLDILQTSGSSGIELISPQTLDIGKTPRPHDSHKGSSGKLRLLVGSYAYPGAAAIAAMGALRGGAGLVYVHVPHKVLEIVRKLSPPEVIVSGYHDIAEVPAGETDARVVGCGLGSMDETQWKSLKNWLLGSDLPTVVDADALNAIASHKACDLFGKSHLLTPHPGEFKRLAPYLTGEPREKAATTFTKKHPCTLLLKGSRSIIAQAGQPLRCNSTGNAGMASGGQGDLLAGVIGARLAFGDPPFDASSLGAWLCGRAAELALLSDPPQSPESLTASDSAQFLGQSCLDWRNSTR